MNDVSQVITQFSDYDLMFIILALLLAAILLILNRHKIRQGWKSFTTRYCLNHLGLEQITNIDCPDGLGQDFKIDRLALRHDGITLLVHKQYAGNIFCADHIDEWTQMIGQKSYLFKNPLFELDYQIKAISACIPDIPVNGYLFFDTDANFPKGHPDRVIYPQRIPEQLTRKNRHQINPKLMETWRAFKHKHQIKK